MLIFRSLAFRFLLGAGLAAFLLLPVRAGEKEGMPDLCQDDQTCLPTSTANLIVWFGNHGYPNLIVKGDSKEDNYIHTIHAIITDTDARYDFGTRTDAIAYGITKYIHDAGYSCDIEYRGIDWSMVKFPQVVQDVDEAKYKPYQKTPEAFTQDWLQNNDDPNKGFILLLAYCKFNRGSNTFEDAINAGHAVTLVNAQPDMILIHDPAHYSDEPGRKIVTPEVLTGGNFLLPGYRAPVSGLLLLSGSLMDSPPDSVIMLTGAVCITMHPEPTGTSLIAGTAGSPNARVGGTNNLSSVPSTTPTAPSSPQDRSWVGWLFDLIFTK